MGTLGAKNALVALECFDRLFYMHDNQERTTKAIEGLLAEVDTVTSDMSTMSDPTAAGAMLNRWEGKVSQELSRLFGVKVGTQFRDTCDPPLNLWDSQSERLRRRLTLSREFLSGLLLDLRRHPETLLRMDEHEAGEMPQLSLTGLHPYVQEVAGKLFADGHYRQALLDTYIRLVDEVKARSGVRDDDGTSLMQKVFSAKNPIIRMSDIENEQAGYMWLFSGAVMGVRNPNAHRIIAHPDSQRTLEWLAFASALFRLLDDVAPKP